MESRRQEALARVEQAEKALREPFKHAEALNAAQSNSARIDQLMADAAKPEEQAQLEPPAEIDPRLERMQRLINASFPQQAAATAAAGSTTATQQPPAEKRRLRESDYGCYPPRFRKARHSSKAVPGIELAHNLFYKMRHGVVIRGWHLAKHGNNAGQRS